MERFPLPLGAWDGLRYFIVALPEPSYNYFTTELWPLNDDKIQFLFNILRMNGQTLTKFCIHIIIDKIYAGIVNRHFRKFATELRPLIDVGIQFLFNILRMNLQNFTNFCIHIIVDKINVGIVNFLQICNRVMALD